MRKLENISHIKGRNQESFGAGEVSWYRGTSVNVSCTTQKRSAPLGKSLVFFLQDTPKTLLLYFK